MYSPVSLKSISTELIAAYSREDVRVGPSAGPDLCLSTFGFWTAKLAFEYGTPFIFPPATPMARDLPADTHKKWTAERIKRIAKVDDEKARQLATITVDVVRKSGLRIDMQAVLFDDTFAGTRERILKALYDPDTPPVQASVAIGAGLLPQLPAGLAEHLEMIGPERVMGPGVPGTITEVVARDATYVWRHPSRILREFEAAFVDWMDMRDGMPSAAEIGLGFCLLQPYVGPGRWAPLNHHVFSPILHYRAATPLWHTSGIVSTTYREKTLTRGDLPLADVIGSPLTSLPRAEVCPDCMAVFARAPGVEPHRCSANGPHAGHLVDVLRARFDEGATTFTAQELLKEVRSRGGSHAGLGAADAMGKFLQTHRATLGLRLFDGAWALMRRPTINLMVNVAGAAPAAARRIGA